MAAPQIHPAQPPSRPPVLGVTPYDVASSALMAVLFATVVAVVWFTFAWAMSRMREPVEAVPLDIVELPGGDPEGAIDETLRVDSPDPESPDAAAGEITDDSPDLPPEAETQETLENVQNLAADVQTQVEQEFELAPQTVGKRGSASGTGRRALGMGPGKKGFPREQRWFVRFNDGQTLDEYAAQLDFFGIELGALLDGKRLVYISKLKAPGIVPRTVEGEVQESRLFMTWQGGQRKQADLKLFQKAGVDASQAVIFQFYPRSTENLLARLELAYRKRKVEEIRRTYFAVRNTEKGFEFYVSSQMYNN